jgi:hypothetical protein
MTTPKHISGEVNVDWLDDGRAEALEALQKTLAGSVTEHISETLKNDPPYVTLPIIWASSKKPSDGSGGPPVLDPLTIQIQLTALGASEDDGPTYRVSMSELVKELIEDSRPGGPESGYAITKNFAIDAVISSLRTLADDMERSCKGILAPECDEEEE